MLRILALSAFLTASLCSSAQLKQERYKVNADAPEWVHYMYGDTVNLFVLRELFDTYNYQTIAEDFNGALFPPEGWKLVDSEGSSWEHDWPLNDEANKVACYPNYWVDATGEQHLLVLPAMDLSNMLNLTMTWDYTYNDFNSYIDSLAVVYRTGANLDWQTLWILGGTDLEVPGTESWFWDNATPSITWGLGTLNLDFLSGEECVEFAFDNRSYYGNHIWVDNVNVVGSFDSSGLDELAIALNVFPNPSNGTYTATSTAALESYLVTDLSGRIVRSNETNGAKSFQLDLRNEPSGVYLLTVVTSVGNSTTRLIKE